MLQIAFTKSINTIAYLRTCLNSKLHFRMPLFALFLSNILCKNNATNDLEPNSLNTKCVNYFKDNFITFCIAE